MAPSIVPYPCTQARTTACRSVAAGAGLGEQAAALGAHEPQHDPCGHADEALRQERARVVQREGARRWPRAPAARRPAASSARSSSSEARGNSAKPVTAHATGTASSPRSTSPSNGPAAAASTTTTKPMRSSRPRAPRGSGSPFPCLRRSATIRPPVTPIPAASTTVPRPGRQRDGADGPPHAAEERFEEGPDGRAHAGHGSERRWEPSRVGVTRVGRRARYGARRLCRTCSR